MSRQYRYYEVDQVRSAASLRMIYSQPALMIFDQVIAQTYQKKFHSDIFHSSSCESGESHVLLDNPEGAFNLCTPLLSHPYPGLR